MNKLWTFLRNIRLEDTTKDLYFVNKFMDIVEKVAGSMGHPQIPHLYRQIAGSTGHPQIAHLYRQIARAIPSMVTSTDYC